ncbi:alpha/beta hydrolase [Amycolatopsis rubida]|uniref:Lysophospholipase, alpha-beta hydrolase superfamily n=1 Tax=Amycolatopsis rubida TaxID=112413 RepID=A0A1I5XD75_9PSEU|nr:alpha/beta fold hydrolase [Amycolatopsis rubida]SFQ29806.1 Lysophospholipase, alpha-beta hydrolase superfamily [Amycolatopsis rubida]
MAPARTPVRTRRFRRLAAVAAAAATALTAAAIPAAASADTAAPRTCRDLTIPVSAGQLDASVHGVLCAPPGPGNGAVQLLLHGGTYAASYWSNLDTGGESYVGRAVAAGYATLALDAIGSGASSRPASTLVTGAAQAEAVHQAIARARAGRLDGRRYWQAALVGHSLGSLVAVMTASRHPRDADAVVLTAYSHTIDPAQVQQSLANMHPAAEEGRPLDPGWLTTRPGARPALFHAPADADPVITGAEEARKDVGSATELADAATVGTAEAATRAITAPVLEANGQQDSWSCAAVDCSSSESFKAAEQHNFSRPLSAYIQPRAGHALTLAADRRAALDAITGWLDTALHQCAPHAAGATGRIAGEP